MAAKKSFESLDMNISAGSQDVMYRELLQVGTHRLRISIRSDSYRDQCYARVEIWSPAESKWNFVECVHHGSMVTEKGLRYLQRPAIVKDFSADRDELIRLASLVL